MLTAAAAGPAVAGVGEEENEPNASSALVAEAAPAGEGDGAGDEENEPNPSSGTAGAGEDWKPEKASKAEAVSTCGGVGALSAAAGAGDAANSPNPNESPCAGASGVAGLAELNSPNELHGSAMPINDAVHTVAFGREGPTLSYQKHKRASMRKKTAQPTSTTGQHHPTDRLNQCACLGLMFGSFIVCLHHRAV